MPDLHDEQLIVYAQMANLVSLILPDLDINIKETAEIFSKVFK